MTSPRKYPRTARLNESLLEVLAEELERLSDPRLELVTITGVDVTRDLAGQGLLLDAGCRDHGHHRQRGGGRARRIARGGAPPA